MNTHDMDIELPPLPSPTRRGYGLHYNADEMESYARTAIEADRKHHDRMLAHEWIRPALGLSEDAPYRFDFYAQEIEKLKAGRQRRGEPVGYVMPTAIKQLKAGGNAIVGGVSQGGDVAVYLAPQPAEPVAWLYEDELPDNYPYDTMFPYSKVDGVRMFPVYAPQPADPVKVPSGAEIWQFTYDFNKGSFRDSDDVIDYARALLARYGQTADPTHKSISQNQLKG